MEEGAALDGRLDELVTGEPRTEMQRRVLQADWSLTPLGAAEDWSPTLRDAVATALNCRFPMLVMAGPELVMIYNDGYADVLGARHPSALGRRVPEVWPDVWADIEGMIAGVFAGGTTFVEDLPLVMTRFGFDEETYFTFSYSPVLAPGGRVVALLNTTVDTTHRVLGARRLAVLQRLGSLPRSPGGSATEACEAALRVLAEARADVPVAVAYLLEEDGHGVRPSASYGLATDPPSSKDVEDWVREAVSTGSTVTVSGIAGRWPGLSLPGASPVGEADVDTVVLVPLTAAGQTRPVGALLLGVSPHRRLDDEYRHFLELVTGQVAAAVADAQAVEAERRRVAERAELDRARAQFFSEVAVTLQRAVLGPTVLPEGFAVHYQPAAGTLEVGGDWYDVVDLPGGRFGVVVGDVVGRGLDAAAVMGQLRSAGRALLLESRSPAHVLSALDGFAELVPGASCSTVFCGVVDPAAGTLRYSSAGHVPAILVGDDGAPRLLTEAGSLPLAATEDLVRPESEVLLPRGSTLLLYTDGLVERRNENLDQGMARAAAALVEARHLTPAELAAFLTDQLLEDAPDDDVAFLLYRCGD
ncbi:GAF domain-containing protein [Geodermatophilus sp. DF01-2]|uniref:SpoIIE family protein phosphatase n=1 Tax=Geodermatophilus sp. DF01-2 TaxID=2559610 RepID=UPI0010748C41|nr:SpoIIE family protein phosphatase [Geodermatophilus sp. DF01_2]TFV64716.1 GAF domain-containing protein [Geodermatophilus sp. DF01_2]